MDAIRINDLRKEFKCGWPGRRSVVALSRLCLTVGRGEVYGFLGPNGAGKTTTLKILMGLMRATSGSAELLGRPVGDVRTHRHVGYLPESPYFYNYLTAEEFLTFYGQLAGLDGARLKQRMTTLLDDVGLAEVKARQLRTFSKGMLQRIGLAQALIHNPELVVLDEPMSGLDPIGRKEVRDLIVRLKSQGKTVFFSTHIIPDVEMVCDRVGIVINGNLVAEERVSDLGKDQTTRIDIECEGLKQAGLDALEGLSVVSVVEPNRYIIAVPGYDGVDQVIDVIRTHGGRLLAISPKRRSLEDLFFTCAISSRERS